MVSTSTARMVSSAVFGACLGGLLNLAETTPAAIALTLVAVAIYMARGIHGWPDKGAG